MKRENVEKAPGVAAETAAKALADELREALEGLRSELAGLRESIDELVVEAQWSNRNPSERTPPWKPIVTSMPLDPCAEDWAQRLNQFGPRDIPPAAQNTSIVRRTEKNGRLF